MNSKLLKSLDSLDSYKEDSRLCFFVVSFFLIDVINLAVKQIFPIQGHLWQLISISFMLLLFIILLFSLRTMLYRCGVGFFCTELVFLSLYIISYLMGDVGLAHLIKSAFWTLGACVPLGWYVYAIQDKQILLNFLRKVGYLQSIIIWCTLYYMNITSNYSMPSSYALLLPLFVILDNFFSTHRIVDLFFSIISILMILLFGARGPLLCIAFYLFLQIFFLNKKGIFTFIIISTGTLSISILLCARQFVINIISKLMLYFGIYSRTLIILLNGELTNNSGRDYLFSYYWDLIIQKPLLGWGILGGWLEPGLGPHNMLIEILLAFGIIIGGVICIIVISLMFRIFFVESKTLQKLISIFAAININQFFVSGDWLIKPTFFIFAILCLSNEPYYEKILNKSKQKKEITNEEVFI